VISCVFEGEAQKATGIGYVSHFSTCPNAKQHKKKTEAGAMREHLYRGKDIHTNKWVFGNLVITECEHPAPEITDKIKQYHISAGFEDRVYEVTPETVGEFTGLLDIKNARIFEGDIIKIKYQGTLCEIRYGKYLPAMVIEYLEGTNYKPDKIIGFYARDIETNDELIMPDSKAYEVIGNIHDDPEFLKEF